MQLNVVNQNISSDGSTSYTTRYAVPMLQQIIKTVGYFFRRITRSSRMLLSYIFRDSRIVFITLEYIIIVPIIANQIQA